MKQLAAVVALLAALPATADVDLLRTSPRTGIYVESDYLARDQRCDWYFPAERFIEAEPPTVTGSPCKVVVRIRGTLNRDGSRLFRRLSQRLADWPAVVTRIVLNSRGGDAVAAFHIAETIRGEDVYRLREPGVMTVIDESETAVCFSACLVVFAAGFERHALFDEYDDPALPSRLGIHRPGQYDRRAARYDSSADNRYIRVVRIQLEQYFESVGVSRELVDAMFTVPFDDIRLLTEREAREWGLVGGG